MTEFRILEEEEELLALTIAVGDDEATITVTGYRDVDTALKALLFAGEPTNVLGLAQKMLSAIADEEAEFDSPVEDSLSDLQLEYVGSEDEDL